MAWLFTGFSDGEANFYLSNLKNDKSNIGFSAQLSFEINSFPFGAHIKKIKLH